MRSPYYLYSLFMALVPLALSIHDCCEVLDQEQSSTRRASELLSCVRDEVETGYAPSLHAAVPFVSSYQGPTLAVTILSRVTDNIVSYGAYSMFIQALYAKHNGYMYSPASFYDREGGENDYDSTRKNDDDYRYHRKLTPMIEALSPPVKSVDNEDGETMRVSGGEAFFSDYLVWMDADAVPLQLSFRFEQLAAAYPKAHIFASKDSSSMVNTGVLLVRNSEWALQFLRDWRSMKDGRAERGVPPAQTDQAGFAAVYGMYEERQRMGDLASSWRTKVAILEAHELNSVLPAFSRQEPWHNMLHLAAESDAYRAKVFEMGVQTVCAARREANGNGNGGSDNGNNEGGGDAVVYIDGTRATWQHFLLQQHEHEHGQGLGQDSYLQTGMAREALMRAALNVYGGEASRYLRQARDVLGLSSASAAGLGQLGPVTQPTTNPVVGGSDSDSNDADSFIKCSHEIHLGVPILQFDLAGLRASVGKYCHALQHAGQAARALRVRQAAYRLSAEWVGLLQKMVDASAEALAQRERSGVSASAPASGLAGEKDGDPAAHFSFVPKFTPDEHSTLSSLLPLSLLTEQEQHEQEHERGERKGSSIREACASAGRAVTVLVRGYRACARYKSFKSPVSDMTQHSVCVKSKADAALEKLPEGMKLAAELAFDYLVALASAEDSHVSALQTATANGSDGRDTDREGQQQEDCGGSGVNSTEVDAVRQTEREEVEHYLTSLLSSLLVAVHSSQAVIVADMSAGLLLQLAEMSLQDLQLLRQHKPTTDYGGSSSSGGGGDAMAQWAGRYREVRQRAARYLQRALEMWLAMQEGKYSSIGSGGGDSSHTTSSSPSVLGLSQDLGALGVDLRAVSHAASSLGILQCEMGAHTHGLALHYRAIALDAFYRGYRGGGGAQEVGEAALLMIPHLHNVAWCKKAFHSSSSSSSSSSSLPNQDSDGSSSDDGINVDKTTDTAAPSLPPLSLDTEVGMWALQSRSEKEVLSLIMALYGAGFARGVPGVDKYQTIAETAAGRLL